MDKYKLYNKNEYNMMYTDSAKINTKFCMNFKNTLMEIIVIKIICCSLYFYQQHLCITSNKNIILKQ